MPLRGRGRTAGIFRPARLAFAKFANVADRASPTIIVAPHRLTHLAQDAGLPQQVLADFVLYWRLLIRCVGQCEDTAQEKECISYRRSAGGERELVHALTCSMIGHLGYRSFTRTQGTGSLRPAQAFRHHLVGVGAEAAIARAPICSAGALPRREGAVRRRQRHLGCDQPNQSGRSRDIDEPAWVAGHVFSGERDHRG
jgi:hypothetical protein